MTASKPQTQTRAADPAGASVPTPEAGCSYKLSRKRVVIRLQRPVCKTADDVLSSGLFLDVLKACLEELGERNSLLLKVLPQWPATPAQILLFRDTLRYLAQHPKAGLAGAVSGAEVFVREPRLTHDFVEHLYNFWRDMTRYLVLSSEEEPFEKMPYRTFDQTAEQLMHLVRRIYRDTQENLSGEHPRIYRQVSAGAQAGTIASIRNIPLPDGPYRKLCRIPVIRQVMIYPPLVLDPPMNKRKGRFVRISENPLERVEFVPEDWLCYPAKVGPLTVLIYFHEKYFGLGLSLSNLFQLAGEEDLKKKPDAVYAYGVPGGVLNDLAEMPTVFFDDEAHQMMVGAVPGEDMFGYFGYLKKMVLTLHNIQMMKKGRMPFHGALIRVVLKSGKEATLLMMGDTGTGKSETLEAFRELGHGEIRDLIVIADDMGSLELREDQSVIGYGTETGAFLRLDDLQPGYAFGQIDRAIIMSPNKINARILLPVTTYENLMLGHKIDYVLYANNYEEIDEEHPIIERFKTPEEALKVFREGMAMSKGTTASTGLVHNYFANIFGPPQYKEVHDKLAMDFFRGFFRAGVFVGQMRTRLGMQGWERKGPEESARELLKQIKRA